MALSTTPAASRGPRPTLILSSLADLKRYYRGTVSGCERDWIVAVREAECEALEKLTLLPEIRDLDIDLPGDAEHPFFCVSNAYFDRFLLQVMLERECES